MDTGIRDINGNGINTIKINYVNRGDLWGNIKIIIK